MGADPLGNLVNNLMSSFFGGGIPGMAPAQGGAPQNIDIHISNQFRPPVPGQPSSAQPHGHGVPI